MAQPRAKHSPQTAALCIPFVFHLKTIGEEPRNSTLFDTPESTPAGYKSLIAEYRVASQAGRRGFPIAEDALAKADARVGRLDVKLT